MAIHVGWRLIDGELCYLHADGAITAQGARTDLDVDLSDCPGYRLPDPPAPPELHQAIGATLRLRLLLFSVFERVPRAAPSPVVVTAPLLIGRERTRVWMP